MGNPSARFKRTSMRCFTAVCCILSLTSHMGAESVGTSAEVQDRSDYLYENWKLMYGLDLPSDHSPVSNDSPALKLLPLAPHLHDCSALEKKAYDSDTLGANGELPDWWGEEGRPQPPWVVGGEEENLPLTHTAQADIWRNQHPVNCSADGMRFIFGGWAGTLGHGLGSQIHVMTTLLSYAVEFGRVLVVGPDSFSRARHAGCKGREWGSLECYFRSMSKPECTHVVLRLLKERRNFQSPERGRALLRSPVKVVRLVWGGKLESNAAIKWGTPWVAPATTDLFGVVSKRSSRGGKYEKVQWWRAQAVRYMMRWPSPYLCHVTNNVRHRVIGKETANCVALTEMGQRRAAESYSKGKLKSADLDVTEMSVINGLQGEPYMPRPIVSIHVRQGDKAKEMRLFSFAAHMWMAERLRFHVPNLDHVWLSTEMESVVQESKEYKEWNFLYTENKRQLGVTKMDEYEVAIGKRVLLDASFANLLISAECDYFVGTLGSNWNRLINELRLTNGRFKAGYISLNYGEW